MQYEDPHILHQAGTLSQTQHNSDVSLNEPSTTPSTIPFIEDDTSNIEKENSSSDGPFDFAQAGVFHLDEMSEDEISNVAGTLLQDFSDEAITLDAITDHYNKAYGMNNVTVKIDNSSIDFSTIKLLYSNNRIEVVNTDYIDSVIYYFPFIIQEDNTIKYNRTSSNRPSSSIVLYIYNDKDKAYSIYHKLIENEKVIQRNSVSEEHENPAGWWTTVTNSSKSMVSSTIWINFLEDTNYYEIKVSRGYLALK